MSYSLKPENSPVKFPLQFEAEEIMHVSKIGEFTYRAIINQREYRITIRKDGYYLDGLHGPNKLYDVETFENKFPEITAEINKLRYR